MSPATTASTTTIAKKPGTSTAQSKARPGLDSTLRASPNGNNDEAATATTTARHTPATTATSPLATADRATLAACRAEGSERRVVDGIGADASDERLPRR